MTGLELPADTKPCTKCKVEKPCDETGFYKDKRARDGLSSWCRECTNSQPKAQTRVRIIRNRARHRAVALLVENHPEEFGILYELCRADAEEEDERLTADPETRARFGNATPRLRTGRRKPGEPPETRVNESWCPRCAAYHALDHHAPHPRPRRTVAEEIQLFEAEQRARGRSA